MRDTLRWLGHLRPFILGGILWSFWVHQDPLLMEPLPFLASAPERVTATFTRCGPGRGQACVIDGDTFKLGKRKVRIIGIDTPETHPARCPREAELGEQATVKLLVLLNQGPFDMIAPTYRDHDAYGRDLRTIERRRADGSVQSIASEMRASGLARRYAGGLKLPWC